jgi:hypothetical protein
MDFVDIEEEIEESKEEDEPEVFMGYMDDDNTP